MTIVLSTSNVEGLPNVPIEAQSLGIPVVATDAGGTRETFIDGETGYLCPVGEAEALVAAAERVLGDAAWRTQARARGIENCRANFDINAMRSKLLATYGIGQRD
jgi:glycosyltransferase involved in cell wall biosynthesis